MLDRDEDYLNLLVQPASDYLIITNHVVDRETNILLRLERDDFLSFSCSRDGSLTKRAKTDCAGNAQFTAPCLICSSLIISRSAAAVSCNAVWPSRRSPVSRCSGASRKR